MEENPLTRELTKEELAEFRSAFDMFDIDGGGTLFFFCFGGYFWYLCDNA
jgi:hypothetical protein